MFKVISKRKLENCSGSGAYGQYFKVKGKDRGVKVIRDKYFGSVESAKEAFKGDWEQEFNFLKRLRKKTKLVPKPYYPVVVKTKLGDYTAYMVGYMMSHVDGQTLYALGGRYDLKPEIKTKYEKANERMLKILGINYGMGDDHDGNIMVSKKKDVVFIDVGRLSWGAKI